DIEAYIREVEARATSAMREITALLQADAQLGHTFTNRTGNLEGSIVGDLEGATSQLISGYLAATMDYAAFVELANQGAYAYLMPVFEARKDDILTILKR
ncbi:MAG: hypothetical protein V4671_02270, partial [Armatimonadota bacterium]